MSVIDPVHQHRHRHHHRRQRPLRRGGGQSHRPRQAGDIYVSNALSNDRVGDCALALPYPGFGCVTTSAASAMGELGVGGAVQAIRGQSPISVCVAGPVPARLGIGVGRPGLGCAVVR